MIAVEEVLEFPAQDGAGLVVGLPQLLEGAGLGQVQGRFPELGVHQDVEEEGQALVHVLAQDGQRQRRGPLGHGEVQRATQEVEPFLDRRSLPGLGPALDERGAHEGGQALLVLGQVEAAEIDVGGEGEERQGMVLLDEAPHPVGEGHLVGRGIGRGVGQGGIFEVRGFLGLAEAEPGHEGCADKREDDGFFHDRLLPHFPIRRMEVRISAVVTEGGFHVSVPQRRLRFGGQTTAPPSPM